MEHARVGGHGDVGPRFSNGNGSQAATMASAAFGSRSNNVDSSPTLVELFSALANADRIAILRDLASCEQAGYASPFDTSISAIAERTGLTRFSASRHLSLLSDAGLVDVERVGYRKLHALRSEHFEQIEDWLITFWR